MIAHLEKSLNGYKEKISAGVVNKGANKGKPYSKSTLRGYNSNVRIFEKLIEEQKAKLKELEERKDL